VDEAFGQSLPFAVGAAISPIPIVSAVMLLTTPGSRAKIVAFLVGWLSGLAAVGLLVILIAGGGDGAADDGPGEVVAVAMLAGAAILFWLGVRSWQKRPRGDEEPEVPKWMERIAGFGTRQSAGLGLGAACNPKNLLLTTGGALEIASAGASTSAEIAALSAFVAVSSAGVLTPVILRLIRGQKSAQNLEALGDWLARNNSTIMAVVLVLLAASLAGDAIPALFG
jgi:threonine/homoserine/homoserine lactone efflux protein